jgi:plastocyanin
MMLLLTLAATGLVAGIGATIQNYRQGERRMPRWLSYAFVALFALALGAILLSLVPQTTTSAGVSPEVLAGLPEIETKDFAFSQRFLKVKAGETVAFRLENTDGSAHSFDIDELGVHAPMAAGETGLALFQPTEPGTYTYYCSIPGHADPVARTGMIGTLVVE